MACEETVKTNKGKAAVSGVLAATLACGMVPAVALAQPADDQEANDGIELQDVGLSDQADFGKGSVTSLAIDGSAVDAASVPGRFEGSPLDFKYVTTSQKSKVDMSDYAYTVSLVKDSDKYATSAPEANDAGWAVKGNYPSNKAAVPEVGTWWVQIKVGQAVKKGTDGKPVVDANGVVQYEDGKYTDSVLIYKMTVTASSLAEAKAFEPKYETTTGGPAAQTRDFTDTELTYDASAQDIHFVLDGVDLISGVRASDGRNVGVKADVVWYDSKGVALSPTNASQAGPVNGKYVPKAAGTYRAELTGRAGTAYAGQKNVIEVTVDVLDLSKAAVTVADAYGSHAINESSVTAINGEPTTALVSADDIAIECTTGPTGAVFGATNGTYGITVSAKKLSDGRDNPNVTGSKTVTAYHTTSAAVIWNYAGQTEPAKEWSTDLSAKDQNVYVPTTMRVYADKSEWDSYSDAAKAAQDGYDAAVAAREAADKAVEDAQEKLATAVSGLESLLKASDIEDADYGAYVAAGVAALIDSTNGSLKAYANYADGAETRTPLGTVSGTGDPATYSYTVVPGGVNAADISGGTQLAAEGALKADKDALAIYNAADAVANAQQEVVDETNARNSDSATNKSDGRTPCSYDQAVADWKSALDNVLTAREASLEYDPSAALDVAATTTKENRDIELAYTHQVYDADGAAVADSALSEPGEYTVVFRVNPAAAGNEYNWSGSYTVKVKVIAGTIGKDDVVIKQNGVLTESPSFEYDGTDKLGDVDVTVTVGGKELVRGTDYDLVVVDSKGNETAEAVNAGTYTVRVKSAKYNVNDGDDTFKLVITKLKPNAFQAAGKLTDAAGQTFLDWTGEAIVPGVQFNTASNMSSWRDFDASLYTLSYAYNKSTKATDEAAPQLVYKACDGIKDAGWYRVTVTLTEAGEANHELVADEFYVLVKDDASFFADVKSDYWFYTEVNKAKHEGYVDGYEGTNLFGPYDKITRAQVCQILFNMAGGEDEIHVDATTSGENGQYSYNTPFSDVDGSKWYARAIAWASEAGIVQGYGGTDKFGPDDAVTREQFALMLSRYAEARGDNTSADTETVLAAATDGASVSGWAKDGCAWAVDKKVMGVDSPINPKGKLNRAEAAAMCVRYQPSKEA